MWQQKVLYEGSASGLFRYDAFLIFMGGKGLHIHYDPTALRRMEQYIIEPATTLTYKTWKRVIPRGIEIWDVKVTLSGYGVSEVEQKLQSLFTIESFE